MSNNKAQNVDRKKFPHDCGDFSLSDLMVLRSAAGWYIGRLAFDHHDEFEEPGSRESVGYFKTKEMAEQAMLYGFELRQSIEVQAMYEKGLVPKPEPLKFSTEDSLMFPGNDMRGFGTKGIGLSSKRKDWK